MPDHVSLFQLAALFLAVGGVGGFLAGMLGFGGGILFVPALFFFLTGFHLDGDSAMHVAVGSSFVIIFLTGLSSAYAHYRRGSIDTNLLKSWGPFVVAGVLIGTMTAAFTHGETLRRIFATVALLLAVYMVSGYERREGAAPGFFTGRVQKAICVGVGAVAAMIGVGGAVMTVPLMTYIGMAMQRAAGTSAVIGLMISLPAAAGYILTGALSVEPLPPYSLGYVNLPAALSIAFAAALAAPIGVRLAHRLDKKALRLMFAAVLFAVSAKMFVSL